MVADGTRGTDMTVETKQSALRIERAGEILNRVRDEVGRALVGQRRMVDGRLVGLLTGGHVLLEGVPGLAKTLAVKSLADSLSLKFRRIQFTPDLLPADLTGTLIYNPRDGSFTAKQGPLFAHLILADEINRAPAKVQSALLEARASLSAVYVDDKIQEYVLDVVAATRRPRDFGLALDTLLALGASPRATLFMVRGAQAMALLEGRAYVLPEDVKSVALDVL